MKNNDVAYLRQRLRGMGRESRHNVISRRDNLMLSPDQHLETKNGIIKSVREVQFKTLLNTSNNDIEITLVRCDILFCFYPYRKWKKTRIHILQKN